MDKKTHISMSKIFENLGMRKPRYSAFDLSRETKLSMKMGDLVPVYIEEIVPGDQFRVKSEIMMRLAPMISPVMHRVNVYMHYFFVPNRIIWNAWEEFITGGREGTTVNPMPIFNMAAVTGGITEGSLADYLGLPATSPGSPVYQPSALPFHAYHQIWNDYYRDPNLTPAINVQALVSADSMNVLRKRCWEKDYATSALPWPQRGPAVNLPASVQYRDVSEVVRTSDGAHISGPLGSDNVVGNLLQDFGGGSFAARLENLEDDPINVTINDLRTSSALQRWLEKNARGGYRYIEQILSHFGVKSSDARLQRPEYLGGGRQPVVISEVLNNTGTTAAPQGEMAGHGLSIGQTNSFNKRFEEHGYVMGICSVLPRTAYQQGIHRHWMRKTREEYYWPEFANLGEQEVRKAEVMYNEALTEAENNETFGYQQRYAEMKYGCSSVHGDFRSTLNFWHMGRIFSLLSPPELNEDFVTADPTDRIFAVQDGSDHLWVQMYHDVKARRPMPYFADPRLS